MKLALFALLLSAAAASASAQGFPLLGLFGRRGNAGSSSSSGSGSGAAVCPPPGFDSAAGFDIKKYISAPWYPLEQMPVFYQPVSQLYCVRAVYSPNNPADLNAGIKVLNTANDGSVTGRAVGSSGSASGFSSIVAYPAGGSGPTAASKLSVGPGFLPKSFYGPYWVVAFDPNYEWAIVSGGAPTTRQADGCSAGNPGSTNPFNINGSGLWLFSRTPDHPAALQTMRAKAKALGYDTSVLKPVVQKGCTYPSA